MPGHCCAVPWVKEGFLPFTWLEAAGSLLLDVVEVNGSQWWYVLEQGNVAVD